MKIALNCGIFADSEAEFRPTAHRSAGSRPLDDLTILDGIADKGVYSAYTPD